MRVLRYEVPVDGMEHVLELNGAVLHVDCRRPDTVEVWARDSGGPVVERTFLVIGTGQPVVDGERWKHRGTALSPGLPPFAARGDLVWHLFEAMS